MRLLSAVVLLVTSVSAFAQDSLVYLSEIHFDSPFEKYVFEAVSSRKHVEAFNLLIANGSLLTEPQIEKSKNRLYSYLQSLNTEKFHKKNPAAKVKTLTTDFRKDYLLKYVSGSRFEDIFAAGYFSEVSGTALYCLAFDYLNIPYTIKDEQANTYVIAYPESDRIVVESTTTAITFFTYETAFKLEYVQSLRKQKIISEQEFAKSTTNTLFDKYYFGQNQLLTIRDLAGLQYFNEGTMLLQNNSFEMALQKMEKAYFLTPAPKFAYMLMQAGSRAYLNHPKKDEKHAALLGKLSRYSGVGITTDMVSGEFFKIVQELLFERGQPDQLNAYYTILTKTIKDAEIKLEVDFVYQIERGRYLYNQRRYSAALVPFEAALQVKPTSQQAATMVIGCLGMLADSRLQDEDFVKNIELYKQRYPSLSESNSFNTLLAHTYLIHCTLNFENGKPTEAERYRALFEELFKMEVDLSPQSDLVGKAYSAGAVYYFRKGQTKRAQALIDTGLKISPGNYELTVRKNMIR